MIKTRAKTRIHVGNSVALLLVVALLWAQMLGLVHRVLHAPTPSAAVPVLARLVPGAPALQQAVTPSGLLDHLFSSAKGDSDCRVYDQLGLADALPSVALVSLQAPAPTAHEIAPLPADCGFGTFLFEARGPPAVR
jgi:hypothetical protein